MTLENPYRHGAYHFTVATLLLMGVNKAHKFTAFTAKLRKVWSKVDGEGWKGFEKRKGRNTKTAKDLTGRIMQNCRVLQRVKDYGRPLLKAGAVLDLTRNTGGVLHICLNTKSKKPLKPGRANKPEAKPAIRKPKATRKPSPSRKRSGKPFVRATEPSGTNITAPDAVAGEGAAAESAKDSKPQQS